MKILFVCHGIGNGGAERVVTILANQFSSKGYNVGIVTMRKEDDIYYLRDEIQYTPIEISYKSKFIRGIFRILKLRRKIKEFKPDWIISFSAIANIQTLIARGMGNTKVIISERTDPSKYPNSVFAKLLRSLVYPHANYCVFQTEQAKKFFKRSIKDIGVIIPNPISSQLPLPYDGVRKKEVVGIGSLGEQKNWLVAIKAFELFVQEFPEYEFVIYGEGPLRTELEEYVRSSVHLKGNVKLAGFSSEVHSKARASSIYVSSSDYEGISNAMLEALALGLPAICTDCPVGGASMFIRNYENGILVPVGDEQSMYKAMKEVVSNPKLSLKLSNNAKKVRDELVIDRIFEKWERLILDYEN